jgi:hypothetical protein
LEKGLKPRLEFWMNLFFKFPPFPFWIGVFKKSKVKHSPFYPDGWVESNKDPIDTIKKKGSF